MFYLLKVKSELDHFLKPKYRQTEKCFKTFVTPTRRSNKENHIFSLSMPDRMLMIFLVTKKFLYTMTSSVTNIEIQLIIQSYCKR